MFFNLDKNFKQSLLNEYKQEAQNYYQKKKMKDKEGSKKKENISLKERNWKKKQMKKYIVKK
jgi:hypothetical protein